MQQAPNNRHRRKNALRLSVIEYQPKNEQKCRCLASLRDLAQPA
jgi:hypothetical protein